MAIDLKDYSRNAQDRGWGSGWPNCGGAKPNLATVVADVSGTRITVHKRIAVLVNLLIDYQEKVLGYLLKPAQTGGYNCRPIAGTNRSSNHAWALAIDENWADNPYTTSGQFKMPLSVPRLWNRYGFAWGGHYSGSRKDYMHFEAMGTPAEMDAMTVLAQQELGGGAAAPIRPTLRLGSTGDAVREVQTRMAIPVTGVFDDATDAAVRQFQTAKGLEVDGIVGRATWTALDSIPAPPPPPPGVPQAAVDATAAKAAEHASWIGAATSPVSFGADGVGTFQRYETSGANIYWHPALGAHVIYGGIFQVYRQLGFERSKLGYPVSDEVDIPDGDAAYGRMNLFAGGWISWTDNGPLVHGAT